MYNSTTTTISGPRQLLNYKDIILRHGKSVVASRSECDISMKLGDKSFASPVFAANMKSILTPGICKRFDFCNWFYVYHRIDGFSDILNFINVANREKWNTVSISIGVQADDIKVLEVSRQYNLRIDYITIDVALSFNDNIKKIIEAVDKYYPNAYLIVGNGATGEWIEFLETFGGVDAAKVGIGVSKSCRTRQFTGFGSTTVSSLIECVGAAKNLDIISDGGLTTEENGEVWIGDVAKALAIGATGIMSGALFRSCVDSPSIINGYFGNASEKAKEHTKHIEGETVRVETNGRTIVQQMALISDSIKSSVSYAGGKTILDLINTPWSIIKE